MTPEERADDQAWDVGWEGHRQAQRRRLGRLPFPVKLRWLEEAQQIAEYMRGQREKRRDPGADAP
jgi:hypothetical protein